MDGSFNGKDLTRGKLTLREAPEIPARKILRTPRIGVSYAGKDAVLPWRLCVAGSPSLSGPAKHRKAAP